MLKSEINKLAREIIKSSYSDLKTKEDYKKKIAIINDIILPGQKWENKFIMERVLWVLTDKFGKLFIKNKKDEQLQWL